MWIARLRPSRARRCIAGPIGHDTQSIKPGMTMEHSLLLNGLIYLTAAVLAVPLAKRLGLGAVLGYLLAGTAIGPWGLRLIDNVEAILQFSGFGVVRLLVLVGL